MNVLFIGLGSIGQRHLRILNELIRPQVIWCPSGIKSESKDLISAYNIQIQSSFEEAIDQNLNFAVIANPTSMHVDVAIKLSRGNIPFLLEKPVSNSLNCLDELQDIVSRQKLPVLVGYNFRYHPGFKTLKKWLHQGYIGTPLSLYAQLGQWLPGWHPNEDYRKGYSAKSDLGGGVVLDLSHEIDLAVALFGPVKKISAICDHFSSLEIETEDIAEISLLHDNNRLSHIHLDYCQRTYSKSLTIIGEDGNIVWDYTGNSVVLLMPNKKEKIWKIPKGHNRDEMFRDQMRHWLSVLKGDCNPEVTLEQGILVTKIALAAKQASDEEKHVYLD